MDVYPRVFYVRSHHPTQQKLPVCFASSDRETLELRGLCVGVWGRLPIEERESSVKHTSSFFFSRLSLYDVDTRCYVFAA